MTVEPTVTTPLQLGSEGDYTFTQLTAPGNTSTLDVKSLKFHTLAFTVSTINTNVVLRAEGSIDGTNFFNLSGANTDTTVTGNGTNAFIFTGNLKCIRGVFVSESGGTDAKVDFVYSGEM